MRVVLPYTRIHPLTDQALAELVPDAERVDLGRDDYAYGRLLERLWVPGEDLMIIEHDVQLTRVALDEAINCPCWWSAAPYTGQGTAHREASIIVQSLGCVRFRSELIEAAPGAIAQANSVIDAARNICPPGHWKCLDGRILSALGQAGFTPHQHDEVPHHHEYEYGCACGENH